MVYRQVFQDPLILHEPSLDALSLRSDVISSINILFLWGVGAHVFKSGGVGCRV